jgi:N,N'-diacetyllegionaminate synthase
VSEAARTTHPVTNVLFLIPARGGSKGLPGKNLLRVGGIPLVGRAVRLAMGAARALGPGCRVICSTDDSEIGRAAEAWGAEVPFVRPASLAADGARSIDVVLHALDVLGSAFDALVLLQPTSPLAEVEDVVGAVALHREIRLPVISVCRAEHPAEWLYTIDDAGRLSRLVPGAAAPDQRQQARVAFRANGAVYVSTPSALRRDESFVVPETRAFVMPTERSIDVDTAADLAAARAILAGKAIDPVSIQDRRIGAGQSCLVIAEAGVHHNGDIATAKALVDRAAEAGADVVTFHARVDMPRRLDLDEEAHRVLIDRCRARDLLFLSTPFDEPSVDFLDALPLPAFRLPSSEITNLGFLGYVARKGKPMILSTGTAGLREIAAAVDTIRNEGNRALILLHGASTVPRDPADAGLDVMATLREAFGVPIGFSDRTLGDAVVLAAVALGACVIERPLTLDRTPTAPDSDAPMEPQAFLDMVRRIRKVEAALA